MIFGWARRYVAHLESEIVELRKQILHERSRAERAIDTLLLVRVQVAPVSPPDDPDADDIRARVQALARDEEFAKIGDAEGVA